VVDGAANRRSMADCSGHLLELAARVVLLAGRRPPGTGAKLRQPRVEGGSAARRAERLEEPPARCAIAPQRVIVIAQPRRRQPPRVAWRRRHWEDTAAEAESEIAEPAASEARITCAYTGLRGPALLECRQRRLRIAANVTGFRDDDVGA